MGDSACSPLPHPAAPDRDSRSLPIVPMMAAAPGFVGPSTPGHFLIWGLNFPAAGTQTHRSPTWNLNSLHPTPSPTLKTTGDFLGPAPPSTHLRGQLTLTSS